MGNDQTSFSIQDSGFLDSPFEFNNSSLIHSSQIVDDDRKRFNTSTPATSPNIKNEKFIFDIDTKSINQTELSQNKIDPITKNNNLIKSDSIRIGPNKITTIPQAINNKINIDSDNLNCELCCGCDEITAKRKASIISVSLLLISNNTVSTCLKLRHLYPSVLDKSTIHVDTEV